MKRTKIICTLGPNCRDRETLTKMIENGMNVARLNFSHQDHQFHAENIATLKALRKELNVPLAILLDTKGPEIRTGCVTGGRVTVTDGSPFTLTTRQTVGDSTHCQVSFPRLPLNLDAGDRVLIDDGKIVLRVEDIDGEDIHCRVIVGGTFGNTRGVNVPDKFIDMPFLSEKDKDDLLFGIEHGVDLVAASFVRTASDIAEMREFLDIHGGGDIRLIAKIENSSGIENCDAILGIADGIMVARGDMGVEIPFERLPGIQKRLIRNCVKSGKPAVTATQMLETMIENNSPTRAEISDVANAVFDSTSAVMLSGETAVGHNPAHVVQVMSSICERAEHDIFTASDYRAPRGLDEIHNATDAVCDAAALAAEHIGATAIIAVTLNGDTARTMSKYRPRINIIGATDILKTYNQLAASWGVTPLLTEPQTDTDALFEHVAQRALDEGLVQHGDTVVITAGAPVGISGKTNLLKITEV